VDAGGRLALVAAYPLTGCQQLRPTMMEFINQATTPALFIAVTAAVVLVISPDWRITLLSLAAVYVAGAVLATELVLIEVAVVRALAGLLAVSIIALTSLQVNPGRAIFAGARSWLRAEVASGLPFRLLAAMLAIVVGGYLASEPTLALPGLSSAPALNTAAYMLTMLALLNLGLTEEPIKAGSALLMLLAGFQLLYAAIEPALAIVALLAGAELAIGLAVSYLLVVRYRAADEAAEA
jgi:hypothetical protein